MCCIAENAPNRRHGALSVFAYSFRMLRGPQLGTTTRFQPQKDKPMQNTLFALSLGFAGWVLAAHASLAQSSEPGLQCGARDAVLAQLADEYGETRHGIGMAANQSVMEVFASTASGSWTIAVAISDGTTCLVVGGDGHEAMPKPCPPMVIWLKAGCVPPARSA